MCIIHIIRNTQLTNVNVRSQVWPHWGGAKGVSGPSRGVQVVRGAGESEQRPF